MKTALALAVAGIVPVHRNGDNGVCRSKSNRVSITLRAPKDPLIN